MFIETICDLSIRASIKEQLIEHASIFTVGSRPSVPGADSDEKADFAYIYIYSCSCMAVEEVGILFWLLYMHTWCLYRITGRE